MEPGPPVCLYCDRIMDRQQSGPTWWKCSRCGKIPGDRETTNLYCLGPARAIELIEKQEQERDKPDHD